MNVFLPSFAVNCSYEVSLLNFIIPQEKSKLTIMIFKFLFKIFCGQVSQGDFYLGR